MTINLTIVPGESRTITVTVKDEQGAALDLTGASGIWNAGVAPFAVPAITKTVQVTGAENGELRITLEPGDTQLLNGILYHWAELTFADDSVMKAFLGTVSITPASSVSVEVFKLRFPEFQPVAAELVAMVLGEASAEVHDGWIAGDRTRATMLLAAHRLTLEGEPVRSQTGQGAAGMGMVKRDRVGDVETEFATPAGAGGSFGVTAYGQEFLALRARSFPAAFAV